MTVCIKAITFFVVFRVFNSVVTCIAHKSQVGKVKGYFWIVYIFRSKPLDMMHYFPKLFFAILAHTTILRYPPFNKCFSTSFPSAAFIKLFRKLLHRSHPCVFDACPKQKKDCDFSQPCYPDIMISRLYTLLLTSSLPVYEVLCLQRTITALHEAIYKLAFPMPASPKQTCEPLQICHPFLKHFSLTQNTQPPPP